VAHVRRLGRDYPRGFNKRGDEGETNPRVLDPADLDLSHRLWSHNIRMVNQRSEQITGCTDPAGHGSPDRKVRPFRCMRSRRVRRPVFL